MIARCVSLIVAAVLIAGCASTAQPDSESTSTQSEQRYPNWPALLSDFRFHWTAAPGVNLTTGPAVAVRAYMESYEIANMTFDINNVYPGFMRATAENRSTTEGTYWSEKTDIRPLGIYERSKPPPGVQHFGFNTDHLLELTPIDDGYRAIICTGSYSNFIRSAARPDAYISTSTRETKDGVAPFPYTANTGIFVRQIEFTQHDPRVPVDAPRPVTGPQRGPAPAPHGDVFGNWFIRASSSTGWGPIPRPVLDNFPTPELRQRCSVAMPHDESQRREMMTGYKDQPPPHGDAIPGWPLRPE